jgi:hypothetical protein
MSSVTSELETLIAPLAIVLRTRVVRPATPPTTWRAQFGDRSVALESCALAAASSTAVLVARTMALRITEVPEPEDDETLMPVLVAPVLSIVASSIVATAPVNTHDVVSLVQTRSRS